jgi:hypothetical protein
MLAIQMMRLMENLVGCLTFIIRKTDQLSPQTLKSSVVSKSLLMCLVALVALLLNASMVLICHGLVLLTVGLVTALISLLMVTAHLILQIMKLPLGLVTALIPLLAHLKLLEVLMAAHLISPIP